MILLVYDIYEDLSKIQEETLSFFQMTKLYNSFNFLNLSKYGKNAKGYEVSSNKVDDVEEIHFKDKECSDITASYALSKVKKNALNVLYNFSINSESLTWFYSHFINMFTKMIVVGNDSKKLMSEFWKIPIMKIKDYKDLGKRMFNENNKKIVKACSIPIFKNGFKYVAYCDEEFWETQKHLKDNIGITIIHIIERTRFNLKNKYIHHPDDGMLSLMFTKNENVYIFTIYNKMLLKVCIKENQKHLRPGFFARSFFVLLQG